MINDFLINGQYQHATSESYDVLRPADGSVLATLPSASPRDVAAAVAAAKAAFHGSWRRMDELQRHRLFLQWADLLEARTESIATWVAADAGTGLDGPRATVGKIAAMARYYAGFILTNYGEVLALADEHLNFVVREPVGVVAAMPPWNSPLESTMQKLGPALAAGNTVVLRAPEEGPCGALLVAQAAHDAGFPPGVINVITGGGPASGAALVDHPDVRLVSFTGSVATGKTIAQACAAQMKRCVLELGGKSPVLVFADADLTRAVTEAVDFAFCYQGQVCCANTRILIEAPIFDTVTAQIVARTRALSAPPAGPLFNRKVFEAVRRYVEIGRRDGRLLAGGNPVESSGGFYFEPTVFAFADTRSPVCQEEIFGPVLSLIRFQTEDEAYAIANETNYGLAATIYSGSRGRILRAARRLQAGTVWANCSFKFNIHMPWGGPKDSGQGREFGKYALQPYYEEKTVWLGA
jgi:aldehyde dehydrogenase (NAD+)